jgi:hypothetical protein
VKGCCTGSSTKSEQNKVSQSVKEVLQSLVDDGLVQYDKIGASNCQLPLVLHRRFRIPLISLTVYWSFPSQRGAIVRSFLLAQLKLIQRLYLRQIQAKLSTAQETRESCEKQIAELKANVEAEKALRPETV